jgi:DNA mismatch endonuclease (patch repair protein)
MPSANRRFWKAKLQSNSERDKRTLIALRSLGWRVFTIWECEVADERQLKRLIRGLQRLAL